MKKNILLNTRISHLIASLRHQDMVGIINPKYSNPTNTSVIDLALKKNTPKFLVVLKTILKEMKIEKFVFNKSLSTTDKEIFDEVNKLANKYDIQIEYLPVLKLKENFIKTKAIIRTGDFTDFTNLILVAGDITKK